MPTKKTLTPAEQSRIAAQRAREHMDEQRKAQEKQREALAQKQAEELARETEKQKKEVEPLGVEIYGIMRKMIRKQEVLGSDRWIDRCAHIFSYEGNKRVSGKKGVFAFDHAAALLRQDGYKVRFGHEFTAEIYNYDGDRVIGHEPRTAWWDSASICPPWQKTVEEKDCDVHFPYNVTIEVSWGDPKEEKK